jgi:serine protease
VRPRPLILVPALLLFSLLTTTAPAGAAASQRYMVESASFSQAKALVVRAGGRVVLELPEVNAVAAMISGPGVALLRADARVRRIELDPRRSMNAQTTPYGIPMVQADQVASANPAAVKVCVIDSGLYTSHEDIATTGITGSPNGGAGDWFKDGSGHGTHVAGTIAALNNSVGVVGVAPGISLHIVRVFGDDGTWAYASNLMRAVTECRKAMVKVINMSLGGAAPSSLEESYFDNTLARGVLPIAAAGNGGDNTLHYPAAYGSVVSVAAIDSTKTVADFSQQNADVELAAPGVDVLSTVPWLEDNTLTVGSTTFQATYMQGGVRTAGTSGSLADGGLCTSPGSWTAKVVLCQRGNITFKDKVANVAAGGGVAAVIYNNQPGRLQGTLIDPGAIPAIALTQADGATALGHVGENGTVVSLRTEPASGYDFFSGTSMSAPHVSGVAALVWSHNTSWTPGQIRNALDATATDLGAPGRDVAYGFGLVQAKAALCFLQPANPACP